MRNFNCAEETMTKPFFVSVPILERQILLVDKASAKARGKRAENLDGLANMLSLMRQSLADNGKLNVIAVYSEE